MQELLNLLKKKIVLLRQKTNGEYDLNDDIIEHLYSVYPFNKFEYIISHLIAKNIISLDQYIQIRSEYMERNKYLFVFEITAPRDFGEKWAQQHLNLMVIVKENIIWYLVTVGHAPLSVCIIYLLVAMCSCGLVYGAI